MRLHLGLTTPQGFLSWTAWARCVTVVHTSRVRISAIGPKPVFLFFERTRRWRRVPIGCLTAQSHEPLQGKPPLHSGVHSKKTSSPLGAGTPEPVSYTHLRAHETRHDLVCRLLLEK